jgi:NAD(P)-dependent dehydrogenase (short-subunit alcohol dehydrogenase family)
MASTKQSVVVTGAAAGLGKAVATVFLKRGWQVALVDIAADKLAATVEEIKVLGHPGEALAVEADITNEESAKAIFDKSVAAFGQVDALVNCAGIMDKFHATGEQDVALWNKVLDVNLNGAFLLSRAAVQEFLREDRVVRNGDATGEVKTGGAIVNIASIAAFRGGAAGVAYTTSKWAVLGLTTSTAAAYARQGIRCNAICPGSMATTIAENFDFTSLGQLFSSVMKINEVSTGLSDTARLGRLVAFLCGEDGQDINGAVIKVDRGWTAI